MPQYENSNNTTVGPEWKPARSLPKLEWTEADERRFLEKKARQDDADIIRSVGQTAQEAFPDEVPAMAILRWAGLLA
jgi:hypothetical protein